MAVFHCDYRSTVMEGNVCFNVIVPEQCLEDIPTVYLLHGIAGNQNDWLRFTAIERYAVERSIAVVMPAADKSFYADMKYGRRYYTFISEELIEYTRKMFNLSRKREKTFVAGLSMGGYGALKFALSKPDVYAACASISGVPDIFERLSNGTTNKVVAQSVWGEDYLNAIKGSDSDLFELADRFESSGKPKPWIFQVCGTDDSLYDNNVTFKNFIEGKGFTYRFDDGPGAHTWDVWDYWIPYALDFFKEYMIDNGVEEYNDKGYIQPIVVKS